MSDWFNRYNKRELKREIKKERVGQKHNPSPVRPKILKMMEDNYSKRFGPVDFRKGGMVLSTIDKRNMK